MFKEISHSSEQICRSVFLEDGSKCCSSVNICFSTAVLYFSLCYQEEIAKNLLAEFNLGCDAHRTEHVYRVYVSTFLGFGGNAARQRYEENLISTTQLQNKYEQSFFYLFIFFNLSAMKCTTVQKFGVGNSFCKRK